MKEKGPFGWFIDVVIVAAMLLTIKACFFP